MCFFPYFLSYLSSHILFDLSRTALGENIWVHTYIMHVVIWDKCNQRLCKANTNLQCLEVTHYLQIYSVIQLIEAAVNVWSILNNMTPLCILTSKLKYTHLRVWIGFFSSGGLDKRLHVSSVSVVRAELKSSSWMLNICLWKVTIGYISAVFILF